MHLTYTFSDIFYSAFKNYLGIVDESDMTA